jgi:hypothetical protein
MPFKITFKMPKDMLWQVATSLEAFLQKIEPSNENLIIVTAIFEKIEEVGVGWRAYITSVERVESSR